MPLCSMAIHRACASPAENFGFHFNSNQQYQVSIPNSQFLCYVGFMQSQCNSLEERHETVLISWTDADPMFGTEATSHHWKQSTDSGQWHFPHPCFNSGAGWLPPSQSMRSTSSIRTKDYATSLQSPFWMLSFFRALKFQNPSTCFTRYSSNHSLVSGHGWLFTGDLSKHLEHILKFVVWSWNANIPHQSRFAYPSSMASLLRKTILWIRQPSRSSSKVRWLGIASCQCIHDILPSLELWSWKHDYGSGSNFNVPRLLLHQQQGELLVWSPLWGNCRPTSRWKSTIHSIRFIHTSLKGSSRVTLWENNLLLVRQILCQNGWTQCC